MTVMALARNEAAVEVADSTTTPESAFYTYACKVGFLFFGIAMIPVGLAILAADTIPLFHLYTQSVPYANINYCVSFVAVLACALSVVISFAQAYDYHKNG